jgi:hypothetical protein
MMLILSILLYTYQIIILQMVDSTWKRRMTIITVTAASMLTATLLLGVVTNVAAAQGGPPPGATERFCPSGSTLQKGECVTDKSYQCFGDQVTKEFFDENGKIHIGCVDPETGEFFGEARLGCPQGSTETSGGQCSFGRPGPR